MKTKKKLTLFTPFDNCMYMCENPNEWEFKIVITCPEIANLWMKDGGVTTTHKIQMGLSEIMKENNITEEEVIKLIKGK